MTGHAMRDRAAEACLVPGCRGDKCEAAVFPGPHEDYCGRFLARYRTIVADPPWPYPSSAGNLRASKTARPNSWMTTQTADGKSRYGFMTISQLCALKIPSEPSSHLYLWFTNAFGAEAHTIAGAWGFSPKTILTWVKTKPDGSPSMKTGYYFRGATEHCLFAVRGSLPLQTDVALPTAYLWPRLPHSVKPDAFYDLVEQASPGPYLELFARRARFGWDYWGNESLETAEVSA